MRPRHVPLPCSRRLPVTMMGLRKKWLVGSSMEKKLSIRIS
jgi:hypothetical protein